MGVGTSSHALFGVQEKASGAVKGEAEIVLWTFRIRGKSRSKGQVQSEKGGWRDWQYSANSAFLSKMENSTRDGSGHSTTNS